MISKSPSFVYSKEELPNIPSSFKLYLFSFILLLTKTCIKFNSFDKIVMFGVVSFHLNILSTEAEKQHINIKLKCSNRLRIMTFVLLYQPDPRPYHFRKGKRNRASYPNIIWKTSPLSLYFFQPLFSYFLKLFLLLCYFATMNFPERFCKFLQTVKLNFLQNMLSWNRKSISQRNIINPQNIFKAIFSKN